MTSKLHGKAISDINFQYFIHEIYYCRKHEGPPTIHADSKAEGRYLSLEQLGKVLQILSRNLPGDYLNFSMKCPSTLGLGIFVGEVQKQRSFSSRFLKDGCPNLLVVEPGKDHNLEAARIALFYFL